MLLSGQYLSSTSSVYNEYYPQVESISASLANQIAGLSTFLNVTNAHYFCKSSNAYSYDVDGNYMFDYYVGNPDILTGHTYID